MINNTSPNFRGRGLSVRATGVVGVDSVVIERRDTIFHSVRVLYFTELLGGNLANEVDGTTDLCECQAIGAVRSLPVVDLVHRGLDLVTAKEVASA